MWSEKDKAYRKRHPERVKEQQKRYLSAHPPNRKFNPIYGWKRYGITAKQYEEMLLLQGGVCAICNTPPPIIGRTRRLAVDHNHATGKVRGLLCRNCNQGIGLLRESDTILYNAQKYLGAA